MMGPRHQTSRSRPRPRLFYAHRHKKVVNPNHGTQFSVILWLLGLYTLDYVYIITLNNTSLCFKDKRVLHCCNLFIFITSYLSAYLSLNKFNGVTACPYTNFIRSHRHIVRRRVTIIVTSYLLGLVSQYFTAVRPQSLSKQVRFVIECSLLLTIWMSNQSIIIYFAHFHCVSCRDSNLVFYQDTNTQGWGQDQDNEVLRPRPRTRPRQ